MMAIPAITLARTVGSRTFRATPKRVKVADGFGAGFGPGNGGIVIGGFVGGGVVVLGGDCLVIAIVEFAEIGWAEIQSGNCVYLNWNTTFTVSV